MTPRLERLYFVFNIHISHSLSRHDYYFDYLELRRNYEFKYRDNMQSNVLHVRHVNLKDKTHTHTHSSVTLPLTKKNAFNFGYSLGQYYLLLLPCPRSYIQACVWIDSAVSEKKSK